MSSNQNKDEIIQLIEDAVTKFNIDKEISRLARSLSDEQWKKFFKSFEYDDLKDLINKQDRKLIPNVEKILCGIIFGKFWEKEEDRFYKADLIMNEAVKGSKKKEKWPCVKAYAHYLISIQRFFHAENVLKFEIRSSDADLRGEKEFAELYFMLGFVLLAQNKFYDAIEAFRSNIDSLIFHKDEIKREDGEPWFARLITRGIRYTGTAWQLIGTKIALDNAKNEYDKTKEYKNSYHTAISLNNLVNIYINEFETEKNEKLIIDAKKAIKLAQGILVKNEGTIKEQTGEKEWNYYRSVISDTNAMVMIADEDFDGAEAELQSALQLRNDSSGLPTAIYFHLGIVPERKGDLSKAKNYYKKAIEPAEDEKTREKVDRRYASKAYDSLGIIHLKEDDKEKAEKSFKKSLEYDPQNDDAKSHLGFIQNKQTDRKDWLDWWLSNKTKKSVLAFLVIAVITSSAIYLSNNTFSITEEKIEKIGDNQTKITKVNKDLSDYHLAIFGVIVFIILLPSIKRIKAGVLEVESQELKTEEKPGPTWRPPSLL